MTWLTLFEARSTTANPFQTDRYARSLAESTATPVTYPPPPEKLETP